MQGNLWQEVVLFRGLPGDIVRGPLLGKGKEDLQRGVLGAKDGSRLVLWVSLKRGSKGEKGQQLGGEKKKKTGQHMHWVFSGQHMHWRRFWGQHMH